MLTPTCDTRTTRAWLVQQWLFADGINFSLRGQFLCTLGIKGYFLCKPGTLCWSEGTHAHGCSTATCRITRQKAQESEDVKIECLVARQKCGCVLQNCDVAAMWLGSEDSFVVILCSHSFFVQVVSATAVIKCRNWSPSMTKRSCFC